MSLLGHPLQLHDVHDVEKLLRHTLNRTLRTNGGTLDHHDYEDALSYLIVLAWRLSQQYKPRPNQTFSTHLSTIASLRLTDWMRKRKGATRNKHLLELIPYSTLDLQLAASPPFEDHVISEISTAA